MEFIGIDVHKRDSQVCILGEGGEVVLEQKAQPNSARAFGISPRSVRLHIGLEGTEALWNDIAAGRAAARK